MLPVQALPPKPAHQPQRAPFGTFRVSTLGHLIPKNEVVIGGRKFVLRGIPGRPTLNAGDMRPRGIRG
jgi:hypothetical protein